MSVVRPVNSQGDQVIQMPEGKSPPDTRPTDLSVFFNRVFNSLAHAHDDGSPEAPLYLSEGGVWARPYDNGRQTLQRTVKSGILTDTELWWANANGIAFPFGFARDLPLNLGSLNELTKPGLFWYASPVSDAPSGLPNGSVWVQHTIGFAGVVTYTQMVFAEGPAMAVRRGDYSSEGILQWGDWARVSFTGGGGGGGGVPLGSALPFFGLTMPVNHTMADGSLFYINDFPDGWAAFGTKFGGDGIATFAVPDMRDHPLNQGVWIVTLGDDLGFNTRFYTGRGGWVGQSGLYVGQPFPM